MSTNKPLREKLRELREENCLLLREAAAKLQIDPSLLSKIERGDKRPTRSQVVHLAKMYKTEERALNN